MYAYGGAWFQRLLMSIRPRMLEELAAREDDASFRQLRGQRRIATEEEPRRKSQWRRITALASVVRNMQFRDVRAAKWVASPASG